MELMKHLWGSIFDFVIYILRNYYNQFTIYYGLFRASHSRNPPQSTFWRINHNNTLKIFFQFFNLTFSFACAILRHGRFSSYTCV